MTGAQALAGLFQGFDQEEDFSGHGVVQVRGVGEGAVAVASDDGLEDADEREEFREIWIGGELLEEKNPHQAWGF